MKTRLIFVVFIFFANYSKAQEFPFNNFVKNVDENDFSFLENILKDRNIVFLSEKTHYNGASISLRSKVTEYLIKKMGFEVVLFEAQFSQIERVNFSIDSGTDPNLAIDSLTNNIIFQSVEFKEFFKKIAPFLVNKQVDIGGIDVYGDIKFRLIFGPLFDQAISDCNSQSLIAVPKFIRVAKFNEILFSCLGNDLGQFSKKTFEDFYSIADFFFKFYDSLYKMKHERKFLIKSHEWLNVRWCAEWTYARTKLGVVKVKRKLDPVYPISILHFYRDSIIAKNIFWIKKELFPQKKIIIWLSSFHTLKNLDIIEGVYDCCLSKKAKTAGEYLKELLPKESTYGIAFLSGKGMVGVQNYIEEKSIRPIKGSLEFLLSRLNYSTCFIDFKEALNKSDFLRSPFYMNPTFDRYLKAKWNLIYNGIFYSKQSRQLSYQID